MSDVGVSAGERDEDSSSEGRPWSRESKRRGRVAPVGPVAFSYKVVVPVVKFVGS